MQCINCGKEIGEQSEFCIFCGNNLIGNKESISNITAVKSKVSSNTVGKIFLVVSLLVIVGTIAVTNLLRTATVDNTTEELEAKKEIDNTRAVVQILCNKSAGSGTMMTEEGLILTNYHVVEGEEYCVVTIPNATTGEPEEIYYASVITIPELSELYDIATLEIDSVYTDEEGKTLGAYPNKFSYFQRLESCSDDPWKLGEPIKIFGYPATSHNYNLTITEGIISNFSDGYILTSAKIDSGNSGGLAINQEGCMVGIPSAVLEGDYQNLGVIIPSDIIIEFINEVSAQSP